MKKEKEEFYDRLYVNTKMDTQVVFGDFNAKIGKEDFFQIIVGQYSLSEISENGVIVLGQLSALNNINLRNTYGDQKIYTQKWKMLLSELVNQIN